LLAFLLHDKIISIMDKKQLEEEIQNITQQLIEKYKPEKIILFGSAALGKFNPDSDLDFLIVKKKTPYYGVDRMREVERLIETPFPCDFLVARPSEVEKRLRLEDPFLKLIFEEGKILYG
jgi:predicted nucleotidyltransferase